MLKEPLTEDEGAHLVQLKSQYMTLTLGDKRLRHFRRGIRNRLFKIRKGDYANVDNSALKKFMEAQFAPEMKWETFTFNWDVAPDDPMKVITMFEWIDHGGTFDTINVLDDYGNTRQQKLCDPPGFTQQEL